MALLAVEEALKLVLDRTRPLGAERVPLLEAVGRVAAEPLAAARRLPAWDNSAMDGYAVRAAEVTAGATLPVAFAVAAGDTGETELPAGAAARIFTGAPVPPGADAVIIQEDTEAGPGQVTFKVGARPGDNIRTAGSDVELGGSILQPGRVLAAGDLALLAAQGRVTVAVHRAPVVAIASSGNELLELDAGEPGRGQILNSNAWALAAAVLAAGGRPRLLPIIRDDRTATEEALAEAARSADLLLTSGGVSVGEHDHVGPVLRQLSGETFAFWKVALRPGKPLIFGQIGGCRAFGLPGNPISALVTFELFVRPAILRMLGHGRCRRRPLAGYTATALPGGGDRETYLRAAAALDAEGRIRVDTARSQSSGALSSLAGADALVVRRAGSGPAQPGDPVEVLLLGPDDPLTRS